MVLIGAMIGVAVALSAAPGGAGARPCRAIPGVVQTARDTASVLRAERAWIRAIAHHDTSAVACILADDFLDTSWRGVLRTKRDQLHGLARPASYTPHFSDWRVRLYGDVAVVRGLNVMTDSTGQEVARLRFTDVFAYRDRRWRAVAAQETVVEK